MSSAPPLSAETRAAWLLSGSPAEILARLLEGDPLALRALLSQRLAREAFLWDVERALLRLQALVALRASERTAALVPEEFLAACLEELLREFLTEEEGATSGGESLDFCCRPLGLDAAVLGEACRRFNRLPPEVREAFVAAVLEGEAPERSARLRRLSLPEFARRARRGLELFRAARVRPGGVP